MAGKLWRTGTAWCAGQGRGQWEDFRLSFADLSACQVLTIAATEPISLLHSKPPKPTQACGKLLLLSAPGGQEDLSPEAHSPATPEVPSESLAGPSPEGDVQVDFEKIYKYLSSISRSFHGPELSAAGENQGRGLWGWNPRQQALSSPYSSSLHPSPESAVVLDLLMALPEELPHLPCAALAEHMLDTYQRLMAPQSDPSSGSLGLGAEDCGTGSGGQEDADLATPQAPENAGPCEPRSTWQAAGVSPLNPFLVPLELLGRAAIPGK